VKGFREENAAVRLLEIFHYGDPGAAYGQAAAVDGVDEIGFAFAGL